MMARSRTISRSMAQGTRALVCGVLMMCAGMALSEAQPVVRITSGEHPGFGRVVLDAPGLAYTVNRDGGHLTIRFSEEPILADLPPAPRNVLAIWAAPGGVELTLPPGVAVHTSRMGSKIIVDVDDGVSGRPGVAKDGSAESLARMGPAAAGPVQPGPPAARPAAPLAGPPAVVTPGGRNAGLPPNGQATVMPGPAVAAPRGPVGMTPFGAPTTGSPSISGVAPSSTVLTGPLRVDPLSAGSAPLRSNPAGPDPAGPNPAGPNPAVRPGCPAPGAGHSGAALADPVPAAGRGRFHPRAGRGPCLATGKRNEPRDCPRRHRQQSGVG